MTPVGTDFFDGKCTAFVEGFRFVPSGETWTRSDGVVFHGEMIAPWKDYAELDIAQREYERQLLKELQENSIPVADLENAYREGVDSVYD
jgi:hypothetical protein